MLGQWIITAIFVAFIFWLIRKPIGKLVSKIIPVSRSEKLQERGEELENLVQDSKKADELKEVSDNEEQLKEGIDKVIEGKK